MKHPLDHLGARLGATAACFLGLWVVASCSSTKAPAPETSGEETEEAPAAPLSPVEEQLQVDDVGGIPVLESTGALRRFLPGTYLRNVPPGSPGAMVFQGLDGLTLDLTGVELRGQVADADLDEAVGYGVVLRDCKNVTLKGGVIGGYKLGLFMDRCEDVTVESVRFDGWYGQRLRSTRYAEDMSDWLRPHENNALEWNDKYGGAISAVNGARLTIKRCRGRRGQNGILLTRVEDSEIYDNDFSFLSGWGIALYRSSRNVIASNICDYCVRGFSHDVYWRGQDSAGILMFEDCDENLVAKNSATHCGDGVFLYGGNDIVERGLSSATGSDDNVFYANDLRFAVANSLEATFSRGNAVIDNQLSGSHQHGIWGGYSSDMLVRGNSIHDTIGAAITIEHGQGCVIKGNRFHQNEIGIELYWDEDPALVDGPFGRSHDTSSRDHWVLENTFEANVLDLVIRRTSGVVFHANEYLPGTREPYFERVSAEADPTLDATTVQRWLDALDGSFPSGNLSNMTMNPWIGREPELAVEWQAWTPPLLPGRQVASADARDEARGGLESIVMGEWGPWDFRSGTPRPRERQAGGLLAQSTWNATWFRWEAATSDPRTSERAWRNRANSPIVQAEVQSFVNPWVTEENRRLIGNDFFGIFAATNVILDEAGTFDLSVVSDDGIRVFVDEELVLEDWTLHAPKRDERTLILDKGEHIFRFEYFQIQGAAALVVELQPH